MIMSHTDLRAEFARRLSALYGREVPAYTTLASVTEQINRETVARDGADAERFGSIHRVSAERHGAIRVGNARELSEAASIFGAMGMFPVGFYDLRDTASNSIPVVSTAFRPMAAYELAANPFRVFTSMLVASDRRFFDDDLARRLATFLDRRTLFPPELLTLAARSEEANELSDSDAQRFLELATQSFALSPEPIDRAWYRELEAVSPVAADIGGSRSTHINHLTPRVLDIDLLHSRMEENGIRMIDAIQGPPRTDGPDLLLRQTSFRALDEERAFREDDGTVTTGHLRVRFGEVESRGIAVTPAGRALYDDYLGGAVSANWEAVVPGTELELLQQDLAYFTFALADRHPPRVDPDTPLPDLVRDGVVIASPIVYEDFLPKSAAGIFASNLDSSGSRTDTDANGSAFDADTMAGVLGRTLYDPYRVYDEIRQRSVAVIREQLTRT